MKFDDWITQVYNEEKTKQDNFQHALNILEESFIMPLSHYQFCPKAYVRFEGTCYVLTANNKTNANSM